MDTEQYRSTYGYKSAVSSHTHDYLWPQVEAFLAAHRPGRVLEVGCGNGSMAARISAAGVGVVGIDTSESGIELARRACPGGRFELGSAYDDLAGRFGRFPAVVSLEVVEHLFSPRDFAKRVFEALDEGGLALISTPYHGYLKNLALSISGRMDTHFTALWDGGHIKFWSIPTLRALLAEAGFVDIRFERVGRFPALAKSMVATVRRPRQGEHA